MIAFVRGVSSAATLVGSSVQVSGWMSAKTGIAFWERIGRIDPMSVIGGTITSSPGSRSSMASATCTAAVPEELATAPAMSYRAANSRSKVATSGP